MKTSKLIFKLSIIVVIISVIALSSCSKDRIEEEETQLIEYQSINSYFDTKKQDEQEFVIDTLGIDPIIGHEGTKIWASKEKLMFANGDSVQWPYTVKLIELYPAKDMIYYQMPTLAGGSLLGSHGEVKITAFKDSSELVLRSGMTWTIEMPNTNPDSTMVTYYGDANSTIVDWVNIPVGVFATSTYGYIGETQVLGWISCAKNTNFNSGLTNYSFTSSTDNLLNVSKFIYLPSSKSLMQIYSSTSNDLPLGQNIKIIFIAIDNNNNLFHYFNNTTVGSTNTIDLSLTPISDIDLTILLDNL